MSQGTDDKVYVAVGKNVEESKLTLLWALQNFRGEKISILHVHQSSVAFTSRHEPNELSGIQDRERTSTRKILDEYLPGEVHAEKLYIERDDVGEGIVELVYQHAIKKLVMGAAADNHYSEGMMDLKSNKAQYVQRRVPLSCQIWFICKGHLICTGENIEKIGLELEICEVPQSEENGHLRTADALEGSSIDQLYNQLERAMSEADKFKREEFEESLRRGKAEKAAIKAICRAKALESMCAKELGCRKNAEEALAKEKEDHQSTKNQLNEALLIAKDQRMLQEIDVANYMNQIQKLNDEKLFAAEQCKEYKKEIDELRIEYNNALKLAEELSKKQEQDVLSMHMQQFLSVFTMSEILEATHNFDPLLKIGEGGYGSIYKGVLHHTPVAIKVLNSDSMQGPSEFKQEVDILSKVRHPNLVTLIGACSEACILIYEYLPNGSLEDRLNCKDNTPPLSWQTRIRIATELCSVLIFLHSSSPHGIVHGDLKPANILLDANLACKLGDFGICRVLSLRENSTNMTLCHRTDPKGTFVYMDPHFLTTGELSPKSDTYSFGIILLQLLTKRPPLGIAKEIGDELDEGNLSSLLDPSAGEWPYVQAKQLARLALRCCAMNRSGRPDLASEVWRVLEPMRASSQFGSQEHQQPPAHFFCPILQEVMQDPRVAADGFTYEAEALTGWLEGGHDTSPMTNLQLEHFDLVPNRSLRSAIQDWLQQH